MHRIITERISAAEVRRIRKALGFTQEEFARFLWVTFSTLNRWESGRAAPFGMALRILILLKSKQHFKDFRNYIRNSRSQDSTFLLYQLLKSCYGRPKPDGKAPK